MTTTLHNAAKKETSAHIACEFEDLVTLRHTHLGFLFLNSEDVRNLSLGAISNFIKGTVLPWLRFQLKGQKWPVNSLCTSGPNGLKPIIYSILLFYTSQLLKDTTKSVSLQYTCLLTYSMVQSPWAANWFAASQEIPRISQNPKVHYRTHKRLPPVPILGPPNPVRIPTTHLLEIHPNIIHPSMPRSPLWSLSLRFPHQDPIHPPLLTHMCHMPSASHSSRFCHPHNIGWGVQII